MPLVYFLYRCPRCGHDPLQGEGDEARCSGCGTRFQRGREGGLIRVQEPDGSLWEVPSSLLSASLDALGGPDPRARDSRGSLDYSARVEVRRAGGEAPVRFRGEVIGFAESLGEGEAGVLQITEEALTLWPAPESPGAPTREWARGGKGAPPLDRWLLLDLGAVQTSSSSLQIASRTDGLVQFRFQGDSPRRWEELLHRALREAWRRAGRGEIEEFQPRIRAGRRESPEPRRTGP